MQIASIKELEGLRSCKKLVHLSLAQNPVSRLPDYRLCVINMIPSLRVLDFEKVTLKERNEAAKRFGTTAEKAAPVLVDVMRGAVAKNRREDEDDVEKRRAELMAAIQNAKSMEEIEILDQQVSALPPPRKRQNKATITDE